MNSLTEENYLKALYLLADFKDEVSVKELSQHLSIKMPTVNSMVKKLVAKNLVTHQSYKPIKLTDVGKKQAALVIRKHRLTEIYLVEKMGFGWEEVHKIAEQIEHIKSPKFFSKMDELLGFPKLDPHGSPIPDKDGKMTSQSYTKLSDCKVNQTVKIVAVINTTDEFLQFLNAKKIHLGLIMTVLSVETLDKTISVFYDDANYTISHKACESIMVQIV